MNPKIQALLRKSGFANVTFDNEIFLEKFAQLVAEDCAGICEEMGTKVAGCEHGNLTALADDCAWWIRNDFGIK
jgi:hypothetical protein